MKLAGTVPLWFTTIASKEQLYPTVPGGRYVPFNVLSGIDKVVSRDIMANDQIPTQTLDTGKMVFEIEISPDESTVKVHSRTSYPNKCILAKSVCAANVL